MTMPDRSTEDLEMPETHEVVRPIISAEQICTLIDGVENLRDKALAMCRDLLRDPRQRDLRVYLEELPWGPSSGASYRIRGRVLRGEVKTRSSKTAVPLPEDIRPVIEAWKKVCKDTSPDALMFPTFGRGRRTGKKVPFHSKNFLRCKIAPIADKLSIPRKLVTFQVMRRTLGTDMQGHGSLKDAQMVLRHASIKTTGDVYVQEIAESTVKAINSRTRAVLAARKNPDRESPPGNGLQNGVQASEDVLEKRSAAVVGINVPTDSGHIAEGDVAKKGEDLMVREAVLSNLETQRAPMGSCLRIAAS